MSYLRALSALAVVTAVAAGKQCLDLQPDEPIDLDTYVEDDGVWYIAADTGVLPLCPKVDTTKKNETHISSNLYFHGDSVYASGGLSRAEGSNTFSGPSMKAVKNSESEEVAKYTFLASDPGYKKWVAWYRCLEDAEVHQSDDFLIYSRSPKLEASDLEDAKEAIRNVVKKMEPELKNEGLEIMKKMKEVPCKFE